MRFTEQQLRAIDIARLGQDACVVAGPGSGKTTVLVERFRRLVSEAGIPPARILAITFTEKAATNMKQKLAEAFRDRPAERRQLERAYVSTVHGFCMRLLRENAIFAGIDPEFRLLDERQADTLQRVAVNEALDALFAENPERMRRLMEGLGGTNLAGAVVEVYEALRSSGTGLPASQDRSGGLSYPDLIDRARDLAHAYPVDWKPAQREALREVVSWCERHAHLRDAPAGREHFAALENFDCKLRSMRRNNSVYDRVKALKEAAEGEAYRGLLTEFYAAEREILFEVLRRFDQVYRARKAAAAALDYSDLEEVTMRLLEENAAVRERIRAQFDQVLMDEFQDTNGLQAKLLKLVRPPDRFFAVGDINQSIYGFRHAEPDVFRDYREEVKRGGKPLAELTENWRSREDILKAVTTILDGADGIEERALIGAQQFPEKAEPSVEVLAALGADAETALSLEAKWVARRILELEGSLAVHGRVAGFGDFAVLLRNSEVMAAFAAAFDDAGIPYLVGRGRGFYEGREITDLIHMLRVLVNPRDEISMAAVLRSPLVGVSDEALLRLKQSGNLGAEVRRLEMNAHDPLDLAKLERFRADLRDWRAIKDYTAFDRLLLGAMDAAGYAHEPGSRAAANVEKFLAIAREASSRRTLAEFVDELELVRASDPRDTDAPPEDSAHAVRMLTVHAAKGLEFPVVFLAAIHKGMDTNLGDLSFSPRLGLGARWRNPVTGEEKDDLCQHAIRQERKQREIDEGNRLFYVAMTRAEEHLVLSYSRTEAAPKNWAALVEERLEQPADLNIRINRVTKPPEPMMRASAAPEREAPVILERPLLTDQYDSNATVTSVALFASCPRRYYLERYLGWETQPRGGVTHTPSEVPASEFGLQARMPSEVPASEFGLRAHTPSEVPASEFGLQAHTPSEVSASEFGLQARTPSEVPASEFGLQARTPSEVPASEFGLQARMPSEVPASEFGLQARTPSEVSASEFGLQARMPSEVPASEFGLRAHMPSEVSASEFGLQAHALLAGTTVANPHPEALRLAELFRSSAIGRRAARAIRIEREFDFLLAVEDMVLRGQIDLWFEDKGGLILVDYKTDAVPTACEAEQYAGAYGEQLRLYAMALERMTGRLPDHAYIYFLRRNEAIPVDLSPLALQATRNLVRELREAQEKLDFPLRTGDHCLRCPYFRNLCPAEVISLSSCVEPSSSLSSLSS